MSDMPMVEACDVQDMASDYESELARMDDELTTLRAERDRLREALKPFAEYGHTLHGQRVGADKVMVQLWDHKITVGDMRNAADAYADTSAALQAGGSDA